MSSYIVINRMFYSPSKYIKANVRIDKLTLKVSFILALSVWTAWLTILGPVHAFSNLINNWEIALTMAFGSMIAGGSSMGGGAVAFPVLTKVLQVDPSEATVFSLAIQTVGMGSASVAIIIMMKNSLNWSFIYWTSLGGFLGIILGTEFVSPLLSADVIRIAFTMLISSFALVFLITPRNSHKSELGKSKIRKWHSHQNLFYVAVGCIGGIVTSLIGSGMDIIAFSVMVLFFNISEKNSTSTSVIIMAINAAFGFLYNSLILDQFSPLVANYWMAAVPVVVVGAPLGAFACSLLNNSTIIRILITLISIELISSILLLSITSILLLISISIFLLFTASYYGLYRMSPYYIRVSESI